MSYLLGQRKTIPANRQSRQAKVSGSASASVIDQVYIHLSDNYADYQYSDFIVSEVNRIFAGKGASNDELLETVKDFFGVEE